MASGFDECSEDDLDYQDENQELDKGTELSKLDIFKQIRAIIGLYDKPEAEACLPTWYPQDVVIFESVKHDQSKSSKEHGKSDESTFKSRSAIETLNQLKQRYQNVLNKFEIFEKVMKDSIEEVSKYLDLSENQREQYDIKSLFERIEMIKENVFLLEKSSSFLCYDYKKAAGVTVNEKCVEKITDRLLTMISNSSARLEKLLFVILLLKAKKEDFISVNRVSKSLANLEHEVRRMPNW